MFCLFSGLKTVIFQKSAEICVYLSRNLYLSLISQLSVHCKSAGFHHYFSRANASISMSIFSKRPPRGLNIIMKIDLVKLASSDSKGFRNVYYDQHLDSKGVSRTFSKVSLFFSNLICHLQTGPVVWPQWWSFADMSHFSKKISKIEIFFDLTFTDVHMGRQKVPESDFQSQFSMSKIIWIFLIFFHWRISV